MLKGIHQQLEPQSSPAFFVRGPKPFSRLMFFCSVSLLMMAADARFDYLNQLRQGFSAAMHPLEVLASAPNEWSRNINTYFTSHNHLIQENFKLRQQAVFDHAALQRLATVEAENANLRSLLNGDVPVIPDATLGEILHMGRDPFSNIITVNRGSQHHIAAGQAVVDAQGVVGQITRVYPFTSEVTLITDKKLSIPIQIERNQLRAIAFGEGKRNTLDIPYLPTSVDIKVGDKLVTSGIDGVYPPGLAVATVTQIKQSQDSPFAKIISKPLAGVSNHKHVLILRLPTAPVRSEAASTPATVPHANNAQHLDQSVVQVLQQHNAEADPLPAKPDNDQRNEPTVTEPGMSPATDNPSANPQTGPSANTTNTPIADTNTVNHAPGQPQAGNHAPTNPSTSTAPASNVNAAPTSPVTQSPVTANPAPVSPAAVTDNKPGKPANPAPAHDAQPVQDTQPAKPAPAKKPPSPHAAAKPGAVSLKQQVLHKRMVPNTHRPALKKVSLRASDQATSQRAGLHNNKLHKAKLPSTRLHSDKLNAVRLQPAGLTLASPLPESHETL